MTIFSNPKYQFLNSTKRGALLLELLIVISLLAIILTIGSQAVFVSMQSGKISGDRDVAMGLAGEALEAVRSVADEKWQNIYGLTKPSQHYYATSTNPVGKWTLTAGDETITLNGVPYTRFITVSNVNRDDTTRAIVSAGGNDDPSTQKVTVSASWQGGDTVTLSEYFFRWKNKVCNQTDWSGGGGSGVKNCPDTTYGSIGPVGTEINTSGGSIKLQQ